MLEIYKKELEAMEAKMLESIAWAEKLPIFAEVIMKEKLTGKEDYCSYGEKYKNIWLRWGINRGFYSQRRTITNCAPGSYEGFFFKIYVNCYSLFSINSADEDFGLYESLKNVDIFFIDHSNSTFYITDGNIENFLETLNDWYVKADKQANIYHLKLELLKAENKVAKYTKLLKEAERK